MTGERMRDRAVTGFLRRAIEAICEGNFDEAGYLYDEARKMNSMTHYQFEMEYGRELRNNV